MLRKSLLFILINFLHNIVLFTLSLEHGGDHSDDESTKQEQQNTVVSSSHRKKNFRINSETNVPIAIYDLEVSIKGESAREKAEYFLRENSNILNFDSGRDLHDIKYVSEKKTLLWNTVYFQQVYNDIPVYGSDLTVTLNEDTNVVRMYTGNYQKGINIDISTSEKSQRLSDDGVLDLVLRRFGEGEKDSKSKSLSKKDLKYYDANLVVFHKDGKSVLSWKVDVVPKDSIREIEILYDAESYDVIQELDLTLDKKGYMNEIKFEDQTNDSITIRESKHLRREGNLYKKTSTREYDAFEESVERELENGEKYTIMNVTANVFDPDPISTSQGLYGVNVGLKDKDDEDTFALTNQLVEVTLRDIRKTANLYHLIGPYAQIVDVDPPFDGRHSRSSSDFRLTRSHKSFEAVNCYYHIDTMMRYINEQLGISVKPYQYLGGVKCDPHAAGGDDNSYYSSQSGVVYFGEGGVDDAEDPDVIIHELGHGLHDWLTNGRLSRREGLSEGFGDYVAMSYSRSKNLWKSSQQQYDWVFKWDGTCIKIKRQACISFFIYFT